jgi:two-component system, chemotaxis family, chemotaxis protein CheY
VTKAFTILIVDDSAMMRAMIKRAVTLTGVEIAAIHEAANGREAITVLESQPVDAVFTDLNMPVMTGTELLREMAAHDDWRGIVRVIVSTDGSAARREEVRDLNVRLYVDKPFAPEVIRDVLAELCAD